jgi:hypothetical protein
MLRVLAVIALLLWLPLGAAADQSEPEAVLEAHFAAILAEEYKLASEFFSWAYDKAFRDDIRERDQYYLARRQQLEPGYRIIDVVPLTDPGIDAVRITVDFSDPRTDAAVLVSERMHYYLIREDAGADAPLADEGQAWRIEIYDQLAYDTLAAARRRAYLYTSEAWDEPGSGELRSQQSVYRIMLALEQFHTARGTFPFRLLGGDNRRDELISGSYIVGAYPPNGFTRKPMKAVELGAEAPGQFTYVSVDADGDEVFEEYWLLLHGAIPESFIFDGYDIVLIISSYEESEQLKLATRFAVLWQNLTGEQLNLSDEWSRELELPVPGVSEPGWDPVASHFAATMPKPDQAMPEGVNTGAGTVSQAASAALNRNEVAAPPVATGAQVRPPQITPELLRAVLRHLGPVVTRAVSARVPGLYPETPAQYPGTPAEPLAVYSFGW